MTTGLDPDALAALEDQRNFLLQSLDDLDAEHAAGDLGEADYRTLHVDYTRRAAEVLRALEEKRQAFTDAPRGMKRSQRIATFVAVLLVAGLAGVFLARAVGFRTSADSATGNIAQSTASLLAEAETLTFEGQWKEAIGVYQEVLENEPSNVEALTYRGWLQFQTGDPAAAEDSLADAVAADPEFPDAHVFRALVFRAAGRFDEAASEVKILDGLDTPSEITALLDAADLRAEILAEQLRNRYGGQATRISFAEIGEDADAIIGAAEVLDASGDASLGIRLRDAVLENDPDNVAALVSQGRRLATTPDIIAAAPEAAARGLTLLDSAVELAPDSVEALLWRAIGLALKGDVARAKADLTTLDAMPLTDQERDLADQLRSSLAE